MADKRLIKKYPNRRLYDTAISSYVTLEDVKALVLDGVDFEVTDAKTGTDLTRTILLQIISDQEEGGEPIFSSDLLAQIIRAYGGNMQSLLTSYLEKSMDLWADQQQALREQARTFMDASNPVQMLSQITDQNLSMWRQAMDRFRYDQSDSSGGKGSSDDTPGDDASSNGDHKPGEGKR